MGLRSKNISSSPPLVVWEGFDNDNAERFVSLVPVGFDQDFKISEALIRMNPDKEAGSSRQAAEELHMSVARADFGRRGYYIGERTMLVSWFKSACIAIQDCINPKAIQACLKSAVEAAQRDDHGRKIKLDRIGPPIHREFCRQLSIARYGG